MKYYAGLDVSVKSTAVCIVDETGKVVKDVLGRTLWEGHVSLSAGDWFYSVRRL